VGKMEKKGGLWKVYGGKNIKRRMKKKKKYKKVKAGKNWCGTDVNRGEGGAQPPPRKTYRTKTKPGTVKHWRK